MTEEATLPDADECAQLVQTHTPPEPALFNVSFNSGDSLFVRADKLYQVALRIPAKFVEALAIILQQHQEHILALVAAQSPQPAPSQPPQAQSDVPEVVDALKE